MQACFLLILAQYNITLSSRLKQRGVNYFIIKWYYSLLSEQFVKVSDTLSGPKSISTAPQFFKLYTNECTSIHPNNYFQTLELFSV